MLNPTAMPLSLYIHIPWCVKKCPYCDFNSHESRAQIDFAGYVDALLSDLSTQLAWVQGRQIQSIFIGGGTPSLLPIAQYAVLFDGIRQQLRLAHHCEITMEANPATIEHAPFADYLAVGINRLSLGVQSFAPDKLAALGRIHNPQQAITAIQNAQAAGFGKLNVDLMHGLPTQSVAEALADLQQAMDLGVAHLSWYQLTIEPNTVFYRNTPVLPDDEVLSDIFEQGAKLLQQNGFVQYEVSAWSKQGDFQPSQHNLNYWQFGDYLAIGAGAHGKVSIDVNRFDNVNAINDLCILPLLDSDSSLMQNLEENSCIYRFSKSRLPKDYVDYKGLKDINFKGEMAPKMIGWQPIANDELVSEFMLNALRLNDGIGWQLFEDRTGLSYSSVAKQVEQLMAKKLLKVSTDRLQPTKLGQRYLNQILREFL